MDKKALLVFMLVFSASLVFAQSAECGQVLTSSFTLTSDILDCPSNGLNVGVDNIVLDCNGFSIRGDTHEPWGFDISAGVLIHQHHNVVVKNCEITDFQDGVRAETTAP